MELGILHNSPPSTKRGCRAGRLHRLWHGLPPAPWPCTRSQHHSVPSRNLHPLMVPPFLQPHPDLQSAVGNAPLSSKHPAQLPTTDCLLSIISPMGGQPSDAPALSPPSPLQQGGQSSNAPALSPPSPLPQGGQPIALALSPPSPPPQGGQPSDAPGLSPSSSTLLLCPSDSTLGWVKSERNHRVKKFQVLGLGVVTDLRRASNRQLTPKEKEAVRSRKRSTREEKNPMMDTQRLKEWHIPRRAKKDSKHPPPERQRTLKVPGQPAEVTLTGQRSFTDRLSISGPVEDGHPLLEVVTRQEGGQVWVLGNRSLLSLNLARNNIGDRGMGLLWDMLQKQVVVWSHQHQPPGGLKRLVVHRNAVAATQGTLQHIQHYMHLRDPLHRVPFLSLTKHNVPPCAIPPIQI
ncbi:hypothetical protein ACOMHN_060613 [Nucella lapillus]